MRNYFTIDGIDSRDYGVYIGGQGTFDGPGRAIEYIQVPGRNGDLISTETRLENAELIYKDAYIFQNFDSNFSAFKAMLQSVTGYRRLIDTYHPDEYRLVSFRDAIQPSVNRRNTAGRFDIKFMAKPQRFLLSGETVATLTETGTITNPTLFPSKPLLRVTTTRAAASVVSVGSSDITITRQGVIYIDCEMGRAYNGATGLDSYISLSTIDFPTLKPGDTGITLGTGISKIEVTPRWWTV